MPEYIVTEKAGQKISGKLSPGAGNPIELTEEQAAHYLREGMIEVPPPPAPAPVKGEKSAKNARD